METRLRSDARDRIQQIADQHDGKITAAMVLDDARDASSPLHRYFTWDDDEAAHRWRLRQAGVLLRSVEIRNVTTTMQVTYPAYVRDPEASPKDQGMVSVVRLRGERDLALEALGAEFARVAAMLRRARSLAVGLGLEDEVERVFGPLEVARARVEEELHPTE